MAKHNTRSARARAGVVIACVALLMSFVGSAGAAAGITVKAKNADVLVTCTFSVLKVNPSDGTVQIRLSAAAQPNNVFGYSNNVYTQAFCAVYDATFNPLAEWDPFRNGATLPTTSITPNVPFSSAYHLCGAGYVKKKNGTDSFTPVACS